LLRKPGKDYRRGEYWREERLEEHLALVRHETTLPVVEDALPREGWVLDAGCGYGKWVAHLTLEGYRMLGLDRSQEGLTALHGALPRTPLLAGDVERLPFADGTLAAVLSSGVVEHFREGPLAALLEARRVLRPGGLLLVAVPYNSWSRKLLFHPALDALYAVLQRFGRRADFAEYRYDENDMRGFLNQAKFEVLSTHVDDFHPPKAKGLWVDYNAILGRRGAMWELNAVGRALRKIVDALSPWLSCAGILCVARRRPE
jgi:SAM-dependent methyltransferase